MDKENIVFETTNYFKKCFSKYSIDIVFLYGSYAQYNYDFCYIENQSFTMDLAIILGIAFSIIKGIGAY